MPNPSEKRYNGLLIDTHIVKEAQSKVRASKNLFGWQHARLTAREWIAHLEAGHTIQPSLFRPAPGGKYTHTKDYWQQTHFVCCDADNIRDIEFLSDGADKNPDGVAPFTSETGLSERYPTLKDKVYAVTQSVSSMHKDPPHRRYRLIFLFDEPITSEAHYHAILLALAAEFPIIPAVTRSPAQPVFGNARDGYNRAAIPGNTLRTRDYPYHEPEPAENNGHAQESATDDDLYNLLNENNIQCESRPKGGFFVRCPNTEQHTDGICNRTDAYVFIGDTGAFAFHCSHASCQTTQKSTWAAFKEGYNLKGNTRTYTAKQRLHIKTDAEHIKTDAMDTIRTLLKDDVLDWLLKVYDAEKTQLLIVNTGTATGKTHVTIATLENLLMLNTTIEQAEEKYRKALELGKIAVLHKSRWHNWKKHREYLDEPSRNRHDLKLGLKSDDAVGCAYPDRCDAIFRKGHSARGKFCETLCERRVECRTHGYLSQFRIYQNTDETALQVYTAQPQDAVTDAELQETINAYGLNRDGVVLVVDEADPIKMIPTRQVSYEAWRDAAAFYKLTSADVFFDLLLRETATVPNLAKAETTADMITAINENGLAFRDALQSAFNEFEQYLKQYDQTLKQGLKNLQEAFDDVASWGLDKMDIDNPRIAQLHDGHPAKIDAQIQGLPDNHSTLIDDLQTLLDSTIGSETPPIRNIAEGTWEFAVLPQLNAKRIIELTASNTAVLRRQQLRDIDVEITQTENLQAAWQNGNKRYKLNTGRYTPRSLFSFENNIPALTPCGTKFIDLIIATMADGKDTLIVAPSAFCKDNVLRNDPIIQKLHALPNAHIATHQHAIGVNKYSELPRAIVFHYEPHIYELMFVSKAIYPRETLDFEREQVTLEAHGLRLDDVMRYTDERVQQVYDAMCANTMMQSMNRIRPQLYKNKEIWELTAEPIHAPTTPILFSLADWHAWVETDRDTPFDVFLRERQNRDVKTIAEQDNVSERTAYRRNEPKTASDKKARDAEIIRLHIEGHSQRDIAMHCKVNQATVSRVINSIT